MRNNMSNLEEIDYELDHIFITDNETKRLIALVLLKMTDEILEFVKDNVIFIRSDKKEYGRCTNIIDLKKRCKRKTNYIIFFNSDFLTQTENNKLHTIAHEIGHAFLGHENRADEFNDEKMEKEADKFAHKFGFKKDQ